MANFRNFLRRAFATLLIATVVFAFSSSTQFVHSAGIPSIFNYQGRLADSSSNFLGGNGTTYYFKFSIWDNASVGSGSKLWPTGAPGTVSTTVKQGIFNVNIGDTANGYPDTLDYNFNTSNDVFLQVEVSSDNASFQTLSPRQRVSISPFAKVSGSVNGADNASSFGTTTPNPSTIVSIESTSTNTTALAIRARLNQVADLFQIKNSSGSNLFSVDSLGGIFTASNLNVSGTSTLATTTATTLSVSGQTTLAQASTTNLSATGATFTNTFTGGATITNASTTNFSASGLFATNAFIGGLTGATLNITGQTTLNNASSSVLTLGVPSSSIGRIYFANASNNFSTQIVSSSTQSGNITFTLPPDTGSTGQALLTDGNGSLYFGSVAGGSLSGGTMGKVATWLSSTALTTGTLIDNGIVSGVNATSSLFTFNVKGTSGINPFNVASSSNASLLSVDVTGLLTFGNASSTSISGSGLNFSNAFISGLTATNATFSNETVTNGTTTLFAAVTASTTNLSVLNETVTNGTTTLFAATRATTTNFFSTFASTTNISGSGLNFTNGFFSGLTVTNASTTNLSATGATFGNINTTGTETSLNSSTTNLSASGATFTNTFTTGATITNASTTNLSASGATLNLASISSLYVANSIGIGTTTPAASLQVTGPAINRASNISIIDRALYISPNPLNAASTLSAIDYRGLETSPYTWIIASSTAVTQAYGTLNNQYTISTTTTNATIANAANIFVSGVPIANASTTISTSTALMIGSGFASSSGGVVTNAYSLFVNTPRGAANNYAASFVGGNVGIGSTTPSSRLSVLGTTATTGNADSVLSVYGGNGSTSGGNGGGILLQSGLGGINAVGTAGTGGLISFVASAGGASTASNAAGAGGSISLTSGNGGAGSATADGGSGGSLTFTAGDGGSASGPKTSTGGSLTFNPGVGSNGGASGNIIIASLRGNVGIATTTPGSLFSVNGNSYFGGNIYATGTLNVVGLATFGLASSTSFSASTGATIAALNVTGTSLHTGLATFGNASTTNITASTGANLANLYVGGTVDVAGKTTLAIASSTSFSASVGATIANLTVSTNASTSALTGSGLNFTNGFFTGLTVTNASTTNLSSTGYTGQNGIFTGTLNVVGKTTVANASSTNLSITNALHDSVGSAGVTGMVLQATGTSTIWVATSSLGISGGPGGGYATIIDDVNGTLTQRTKLSFLGTGIACVDNSGNSSTDCTVNSGGAPAISALGDATSNGTTSNSGNQLFWDWRATTTNALTLSGGALTTGTLLNLMSTSSALTTGGNLLNIAYTGNSTAGSLLSVSTGSSTSLFNIGADGTVNLGTTSGGTGLLNINTTSATLTFKDTTADFSIAGSSASSSVSTSSDQIMLTYATTTFASIGNGATSTNGNSPSGTITAGSVAIQRPDGKYLIVNGGNAVTTTNIYDPVANSFAAGPALTTASGGLTGNAIRLTNGKFLILPHNLTGSSLYDPLNNTIIAGPTLTSSSSAAFMRPDGKVIIFTSNASTVTNIYNPAQNTDINGAVTASNQGQTLTTTNPAPVILQSATALGSSTLVIMASTNTTNLYNPLAGTFSVGPTMTANAGAGMHAFQRPDGKFMVILGGGTQTTNIYDPVNATFTAGPNLSAAAGVGSHSIQRPDGKFLVVHGNTSATTSIYDPYTNTFSAGPGFGTNNVGAGAFSIMRPDGNIVTFIGGGSAVNIVYNTSWAFTGSWISENINSLKLNYNSIFAAKSNNEGTIQYYIKTALSSAALDTASWVPIRDKDHITASSTDTWIKIKVTMTRPTPTDFNPSMGHQYYTNTMTGSYGTKNFQVLPIPVVYSVTIDNESILRRDNSDFGLGLNTEDSTGPVSQNIKSNDLGLTLNYRLDYLDGTTDVNADTGIFSTPGPIFTSPTGGNSLALKLADGRLLFVHSANSTATTYFDPLSYSTSTGPSLTAAAGVGSNAVRLPNGNFFVVLGNLSATTNIFSATSSTFVAGPTLLGTVGSSSQMIINPDGTILVIHGGASTGSSLCNLTTGFMKCTTGPVMTAAVGRGSMVIQRPDGKYLIVLGNNSTTLNIYDPVNKTATTTTSVLSSAAGEGAHAFQRADGKWIILSGQTATTGAANTSVYDPTFGIASPATLVAGPALTAGAGSGAFTVQRADGRFQTIIGSSTVTTNIYNENGGAINTNIGAWTAGSNLTSILGIVGGLGSFAVQLPDGKYMIMGAATTSGMFFDAGWSMNGYYQSEVINTPNLTTSSVLDWTGNADAYKPGVTAAYVRTGTSTADVQTEAWRVVQKPGGLINPTSGDTYMQVKFVMTRPLAEMPGNERYVAGGTSGNVIYNRLPLTPTNTIGGPITNQADVFVKPTIMSYRVYDSTKPDIAVYSMNGNNLFRFSSDGSAYTSNGSWNAGGADVAEYFPTNDATLEPGDLVSVGDTDGGLVKKTVLEYDQNLLGVVTTAPGVRLGVDITGGTADKQPIALAGRVPVKVSLENGPIHKGDRITSSSVAGIGMKATDQGRVVAVALEDFVPDRDGRGTVLSFVGAQEYMGVAFYQKATNGLSKWANLIAMNLGVLNIFTKDGNVGVGVENPSARLHVDTNIRVGTENSNGCIENGSGTGIAGTCITDPSLFSTSTEITDVLSKIKGLKLVAFNWTNNGTSTLYKATSTTEYAITASSSELALAGVFATTTDGLLTIDYSRLALYGIIGLQELNNKVGSLADASSTLSITKDGVTEDTFVGGVFKRISAWFADDSNGITTIIAKIFKGDKVEAKEFCLSDENGTTCITKDQLDKLLHNANVSPSSATTTANTTPSISTSTSSGAVSTSTEIIGNASQNDESGTTTSSSTDSTSADSSSTSTADVINTISNITNDSVDVSSTSSSVEPVPQPTSTDPGSGSTETVVGN